MKVTALKEKFQDLIGSLKGGLVVSVQEDAGSPLDDPNIIAALAQCVSIPGCVALRINDPQNIRVVQRMVDLPIIGIFKAYGEDGRVWITPSFEMAHACVEAGASIVALDATTQRQPPQEPIEALIDRIHQELGVPVMADISLYEEGLAACTAGADLVATTLSGYQRPPFAGLFDPPDLNLVRRLARELPVPVIAEGRYNTPELARQALEAGAYTVVVGSAITRPGVIAEMFVREIQSARS